MMAAYDTMPNEWKELSSNGYARLRQMKLSRKHMEDGEEVDVSEE